MARHFPIWSWPLWASLPACLLLLGLVGAAPMLIYPKIALLVLCALPPLIASAKLRSHLRRQNQTRSNLLEGLRQGDYSQYLRIGADPLASELNQLAELLRERCLAEQEARHLSEQVIALMTLAVFALDGQGRVCLANPAALALLQRPASNVLGQDLASLGLAQLMHDDSALLELELAGQHGRWQLSRHSYRHQGQPHTLLLLKDLQQILQQESLRAWQQLIRVLSHEVNNSMGPIASLAATLRKLQSQRGGFVRLSPNESPDQTSHLDEGLALIESRAHGLAEFVQRYAKLARLPQPHKQDFDLCSILQKLPALMPQAQLSLQIPEHGLPFWGDVGQIEQLFLNLLKNGIEAGGAPMQLHCHSHPMRIDILDCGSGLANPDNLFVPFYSTKENGSGIGLLLCQQIASAHFAHLSLRNRKDGPGCIASLSFNPL